MVEEDPKKSVQYINRLSAIYRYVLNNRRQNVVSLTQEFDFIKDYLFLYEVRYGKSIHLKLEEGVHSEKWGIPPLTLQLLVENAIKHNLFEQENPLQIHIGFEPGDIYS